MSTELEGQETHAELPEAATVLEPQLKHWLRLLAPVLGLYVASGQALHAARSRPRPGVSQLKKRKKKRLTSGGENSGHCPSYSQWQRTDRAKTMAKMIAIHV